ncbi:hypothetical protein PRZ48_005998 [Zasmidium cellare]|uniref:N-acetyltransferase domain-containing protein n=1 Tax=Zasmidium cellare TaxID=395010 RepID=A0ABR0EM51_ZASCE|nr:hypothetical protein PRZ48_005998 [Zasmidium cellare]
MDLRDVEGEDAEAILAIYSHYVKTSVATLQEDLPTLESICNNIERLKSIDMPFVVAVDKSNGQIAGYAYGDVFNERSGYKNTVEDSVYIHKDYTARRLGKLLLKEVFARLKAMGKKVVIAKMSILPNVRSEDMATCRLHASLGAREVGRMLKVGYKLGTLVDVIIFQLDLEDFEAS